ncbi:hypothetical protein PUN28_013111 [Cardiocondyla obscurior]|uniref:Uncharacterized protein n=1 Tax=Cardiocondyla obscurior TaxID=286306 RepID=A0AAW2FB24_9HYME
MLCKEFAFYANDNGNTRSFLCHARVSRTHDHNERPARIEYRHQHSRGVAVQPLVRGDGNADRQRHRLNSRTPSSPSYSRPPPVTGESRDRERPEKDRTGGRTDGRMDGRSSVSQSVSQSVHSASLGAQEESHPRTHTHTHTRTRIHSHTNIRTHPRAHRHIHPSYVRQQRKVRYRENRRGSHPLERARNADTEDSQGLQVAGELAWWRWCIRLRSRPCRADDEAAGPTPARTT